MTNFNGSENKYSEDGGAGNPTTPWSILAEDADTANKHTEKFEKGISREQMKEKVHFNWDTDTARDFLFRLDKQPMFTPSRSSIITPYCSYAASLKVLPENGEQMEIPDLKNWTTQAFAYQIGKVKEDINEILATGELNSEEKKEPVRIMNLIWSCEKNETFQAGDFSKIQQTPEYQELKSMGLECMRDDREFIYCRNLPIPDKEGCRLYMCPRTDQMLGLMTQIIMKCSHDHRPYDFKFSKTGKRNDRIVFYTTYKTIGDDINLLSSIQQEHPEFFEDMGKNPFWGEIDGAPKGVYFGESYIDRTHSYSSIRGEALDIAYILWGKKNALRPVSNFASKEDITDDLIDDLTALFIDQLKERSIDPKHICFNL